MKKIIWITSDSFIDVDLPIIPLMSKYFNIDWYIVTSYSSNIDHVKIVTERLRGIDVNCEFIQLSCRARSLKIIAEYYSIISHINRGNYSLCYVNFSGIPYFAVLLKLFIKKVVLIYALHNVTTPKGAVNENLARIYTKLIIKLFSNFHVFSIGQEKLLKSIIKTKNANILCAPLALKNYGSSLLSPCNEKVVFLNFGIIREYKRIDTLIKAANIVYERTKKKFLVIIAGKCDNWKTYNSLIKYPFLFELHINSIPNEDVADLFSKSHYFVLPYQDIAQSGAMTVAFNYYLPVIASSLDGFKEFIINGFNGYLFKPADEYQLAEIMIDLINNHPLQYDMLKNNQTCFVNENYKTDSILLKYVSFFNTLIR